MLEDYKPRWWRWGARTYWLLFVILPFIVVLMVYGVLVRLGLRTLMELLIYASFTSALIATHVIFGKTSLKIWRTVWIVFGVGVVGFPL